MFVRVFRMLFNAYLLFFKQKTAYELRISDWSSDVCSSDLGVARGDATEQHHGIEIDVRVQQAEGESGGDRRLAAGAAAVFCGGQRLRAKSGGEGAQAVGDKKEGAAPGRQRGQTRHSAQQARAEERR